MSAEMRIRTLSSEIHKGLAVLDRLQTRLETFRADRIDRAEPGEIEAMVVTQLLSNYYTCLETLFLRISRYFENNLPSDKWHQTLLERMTLEIPETRPRVISDKVHDDLRELLKFRHFSRYYFDLDYDWDRLHYLLKKFEESKKPTRQQLHAFDTYLHQLLAS